MRWVGRFRSLILQVLVSAILLLSAQAFAARAHAGGTVENCNDDNAFSTVLISGGLVTFDCGGNGTAATIVLSGTKIIGVDTTIDGGGKITLSGDHLRQLFQVNNNVSLDLKNIVLENGKSAGGGGAVVNLGFLAMENATIRDSVAGGDGGAIVSQGAADITSSLFEGNEAADAGAIVAVGSSANVTIANSVLQDNQATGGGSNGQGGAILVSSGASMNIFSSNIYSNTATSQGGGIHITGTNSALDLQGSIVWDNSAFYKGGGIFNNSVAILSNVTLSGNRGVGTAIGGGIYNYGTLTLTNLTLHENSAYYGGGISNAFGTAHLTNVTLSSNTAQVEGGGIYNLGGTATLTNVTLNGNSSSIGGGLVNDSIDTPHLQLTNVIVAGSPNGGNCVFSKPPDTSEYNLSSDATCGFGTGRDSVNLKLGPLETNGGPTLTHRLLPGSPAIDNGVLVSSILTDQRNVARPQGGGFDVGAVEFVPCTGAPTQPILLAPASKAKLTLAQVLLDWAGPDCVKTFGVIVRRDSKTGAITFSKSKTKPSQVTTTTLAQGHKYFWQVTACDKAGCTTSRWSKFRVQ